MRTGLIGRKLGMTRVFTPEGQHLPVTVLHVQDCQVVSHKTQEKDGYSALQLGAFSQKPYRVSKAARGHFARAHVEPKVKMKEFRVSESSFLPLGSTLGVAHFVSGQFVDVSGLSIGRGFAGSMKRHNFGGLRASHGVSISHRSHGSTGNRADPGRVFKGKKMAGHYGAVLVTIQNLKVVATDLDKGLILIKGAVPGCRGSFLFIRDAVKKHVSSDLPFPGFLLCSASEPNMQDKDGVS